MDHGYREVNNGVYRCGFAGAQDAYEEAYDRLWTALDGLEASRHQVEHRALHAPHICDQAGCHLQRPRDAGRRGTHLGGDEGDLGVGVLDAAELVDGEFLVRIAGAFATGDVIPDDGAVDVVGAGQELHLRHGERLHDPEGFDVREIVKHEARDREGAQIFGAGGAGEVFQR